MTVPPTLCDALTTKRSVGYGFGGEKGGVLVPVGNFLVVRWMEN